MNTIESSELIEKALNIRWNDITTDAGSKIIYDAYKLVFNSEVCLSCPGDLKNAYYAIRAHIENPLVIKPVMEKSKFEIKNNGIIIFKGEMYSNKNLTDSIAENILNDNPDIAVRFSVIPDSFKFSSVKEVAAKEIKTEETKQDENSDEHSLINMAIAEVEKCEDRSELIKVAKEQGYPKSEYQKKDMKHLKKYIIDKLKSA